jgi:hypothetical protein
VGAGVGREPPGCEQKGGMRVGETGHAGQGHGVRISRSVEGGVRAGCGRWAGWMRRVF